MANDNPPEFFKTGRGTITFTKPDGTSFSAEVGIHRPPQEGVIEFVKKPEAASFEGFRDPAAGLLEFGLAGAVELCRKHSVSSGWWDFTGAPKVNPGIAQAVIHRKKVIAAAAEADLRDVRRMLGHHSLEEVTDRMADAVIRIFGLAGFHDPDLPRVIAEKLQAQLEHRTAEGGKSI